MSSMYSSSAGRQKSQAASAAFYRCCGGTFGLGFLGLFASLQVREKKRYERAVAAYEAESG